MMDSESNSEADPSSPGRDNITHIPHQQPTAPTHTSGNDWKHYVPVDVAKRDLPLKDISRHAVWTLSSCKIDGYGIHELLDDSVDKYWQSDGPQPHTVTIEFQKRTDICFLFLYLDYRNDESYTPQKMIVYRGSSLLHLDDGRERSFMEPQGWVSIDLRKRDKSPSRVFAIQLQVLANHQNGRDTHIRHIRVVGPNKTRFDQEALRLAELGVEKQDLNKMPTDFTSQMFKSMTLR